MIAQAPDRPRALFASQRTILTPGTFDALSARLAELAGFEAVFLTGFGLSASQLAAPDVGLIGLCELVEQARRNAAAVTIPIVADADTGFGGPLNVTRTVAELERAGAAAVVLEDRVFPNGAGGLVDIHEMQQRIQAAQTGRSENGIVIIARTDASNAEEAIARARRYAESGADALFIPGLSSPAEAKAVGAALRDTPLVLKCPSGTPVTRSDLTSLARSGYRLAIAPDIPLLAAAEAMRGALSALHADGHPYRGRELQRLLCAIGQKATHDPDPGGRVNAEVCP